MPEKRITRVEFPARTFSPEQPPPTKRVAAYARVSTMKDAQENSLQSQQEYFTEYIQRHPGWVFAGMYADDGISGLSIRKRDGFNRMVADALDGKIDLILTKSLSRFARNTVDALTTIRSLKAAGVAVYFQKENINTMDSAGEFLITLMSSFAEEESRSISENVTWAVRHRYAQGIYHLPGLLLGYQRNPVGEIQVDESGARVVRFIYLLALAGKSSTDKATSHSSSSSHRLWLPPKRLSSPSSLSQDDMMCRSPESMSIAMLSPIRIIFPSESIAMLSETVNAKSPSSKSKKCLPISEFLQNVLEHFKCGILLCFFL